MLLSLCATDPAWARRDKIVRPEWIATPKTEDSVYLYRVGHATDQPSTDAARDAAFQDALGQVARIFIPVIRGSPTITQVMAAVSLRNVEILPDCVHTEPTSGGFEGWVQVSYPLAEKQKILRRIDQGEKADQLWADAKSEANRSRYEPAQKLLQQVLAGRDEALFMTADMDEARLLLGNTYREQNNVLDARRWYEDVLHTTRSEDWKRQASEKLQALPEPPRFWPMQDRWNGKKVALLCAIRDGAACRRFADLTNIFTRDCTDARLPNLDLTSKVNAEAMAAFYDRMDFTAACKAATNAETGVILGVLFDIDPAKRGKTAESYGVSMPLPDSTVRFFVVRVSDGKLVCNGQYKEVAGNKPEANLAERAALVLITKHLVPLSPALGSDPQPANSK